MIATFLVSTPVNAYPTVQSPYKIDGKYATGSVATYDTSTAKFATGTTSHKANSIKQVTVMGYYYVSGNFGNTGTASSATYTDSYVTKSVNCPSNSAPCGAEGTHLVEDWMDYTDTGITSIDKAIGDLDQ